MLLTPEGTQVGERGGRGSTTSCPPPPQKKSKTSGGHSNHLSGHGSALGGSQWVATVASGRHAQARPCGRGLRGKSAGWRNSCARNRATKMPHSIPACLPHGGRIWCARLDWMPATQLVDLDSPDTPPPSLGQSPAVQRGRKRLKKGGEGGGGEVPPEMLCLPCGLGA